MRRYGFNVEMPLLEDVALAQESPRRYTSTITAPTEEEREVAKQRIWAVYPHAVVQYFVTEVEDAPQQPDQPAPRVGVH